MQLTRQHVIDVLRKAGLPDMAEEALHALPDPVDSEQALSICSGVSLAKGVGPISPSAPALTRMSSLPAADRTVSTTVATS